MTYIGNFIYKIYFYSKYKNKKPTENLPEKNTKILKLHIKTQILKINNNLYSPY